MVNKLNEEKVSEIVEKLEKNQVVYIINYMGLTVEEVGKFRDELRANEAEMKVYKNTLSLIALNKVDQKIADEVKNILSGPTAFIFSESDPVKPAKILDKFMKRYEVLKVKGGILESSYLNESSVKELATVPSKEVLIAKLLMLLNSPISGFVNVLNGNIRGLVQVLNSISEQK